MKYILGKIAKNDSKLDFEYKSVPQIQSNAKVTYKASEITITSLLLNKKYVLSFTILIIRVRRLPHKRLLCKFSSSVDLKK